MSNERTLIVCIDRDDDIGYKGQIEGPVVGRDACLHTANTLALADPEDSDVNAIFQAVKTYDELEKKGEDVCIAVIAGSHTNMIEGDRKIAHDLGKVVWETESTSCILVTDGAEDEFILPIIQSKITVDSIQRVIVKQMPNLEGTYYIIKKLLDDPKVSRTVLVPVGLAMLLYAVAHIFGKPDLAVIIVVGVIGTYLLLKGFGVDEYFSYTLYALQESFIGGRFTFVSYIAAAFIGVIGVIMGLYSLLKWYPTDAGIFFNLVSFVYGSIGYITLAGLVASIGKIIDISLNDSKSLERVIVLPFFIGAVGIIVYGASVYALSISEVAEFPILGLEGFMIIILTTGAGLICAFTGMYIQKIIGRWKRFATLSGAEDN